MLGLAFCRGAQGTTEWLQLCAYLSSHWEALGCSQCCLPYVQEYSLQILVSERSHSSLIGSSILIEDHGLMESSNDELD